MTDAGRIAVLAATDAARARLEQAGEALGLTVAYSGDATKTQALALEQACATIYLIALDATTEAALDPLAEVLGAEGALVLFEDAEVLLQREGWDEARWLRHLGLKLGLRDDVLPERGDQLATTSAAETEPDGGVDPAAVATEAGAHATTDVADSTSAAADAAASMPADAAVARDDAVVDGLLDGGKLDIAKESTGIIGDNGDIGIQRDTPGDAAPARVDDIADTFEGQGAEDPPHWLDPAAAESVDSGSEWLDDGHGERQVGADGHTSDDDGSDGFAVTAAAGTPDAADDHEDLEALLKRAVTRATDSKESAQQEEPLAPVAEVRWQPPEGGLALVDPDAADAVPAAGAATNHRGEQEPGRHADIAALEAKASALSLAPMDEVDPAPAAQASDADAFGMVVVHAGIGGPDAVRQLLGGLEAGHATPVLVVQQLANDRHDRLVVQLQRATSLPVAVAVAGETPRAGHVHVLPAGMGVEAMSAQGGGARFADGDITSLLQLPAKDVIHVILSGTDPALTASLLAHKAAGATLLAQSPAGCYDSQAAEALIAEGIEHAPPAALASRLARPLQP
ncbi:MAG: chemotaxis protein CheB [Pseudoxanthomonas suwonensis]|nr:chemotaxis protein CheB [Pseudoxanthomonas suwonensis]